VAGLATLFFSFNTGQLTREKTKLVNAADAAAYSAGVMHARTMNFHAYTNRAMVANTVAIAQLTSLASWVRYIDNMRQWGASVLTNPKFETYMTSYQFAVQFAGDARSQLIDNDALERLSQGSDSIIEQLALAQRLAHEGLVPIRAAVMREVAEANYRNDGSVEVDEVPLSDLSRDYRNFVSRYEGNERGRFRDVVLEAVDGDRFVQRRSWMLPGLYSDCGGASSSGRVDWLDRRGGTELIDFNEWKAVDALSEKRWVPKDKTDVMCMAVAETPASWGAQNAADSATFDARPDHYDWAPVVTPGSYLMAVATASSWDYNGLPAFHELSADVRNDPMLKFAIRLRRRAEQTRTSDARSAIIGTPKLNNYTSSPSEGLYAAVSGSEAYFERPPDHRENVFGRGRGRPQELGSLFNPYWQVRLVPPTSEQLRTAQAMQRAVLAQ
jgi:hypothetical protein